MSKGKAQNELQETTFKQIGQLQRTRASVHKKHSVEEALHYVITGETRAAITGCKNTASLIRRKWRILDGTLIKSSHQKIFTKPEAELLQMVMKKKDWACKLQYSEQIQQLRDDLLKHKQQTINVTKAGHEYENFIMDQSKRKHQIVHMTHPSGTLMKGNEATTATAEQWKLKFASHTPGPLGFNGTCKQTVHTEADEKLYQEAIQETAFTDKYRQTNTLQLTDEVTVEDFQFVIHDFNNNKQAGTDEEQIQFYKHSSISNH